jgi:hypothetical protein
LQSIAIFAEFGFIADLRLGVSNEMMILMHTAFPRPMRNAAAVQGL